MALRKLLPICFILVVLLCVIYVPVSASEYEDFPALSDAEPVTVGSSSYVLTADGTGYIAVSCTTAIAGSELAETVNGLPVLGIGPNYFGDFVSVSRLYIRPDYIIHPNAFDGVSVDAMRLYNNKSYSYYPLSDLPSGFPWGLGSLSTFEFSDIVLKPFTSDLSEGLTVSRLVAVGSFSVPSSVGSCPVVSLSASSITNKVTSLFLPDSITSIHATAFQSASSSLIVNCAFESDFIVGAPWSAPDGVSFKFATSPDKIMKSLFAVYSSLGSWFVSALLSMLAIFYTAESGLSILGVLACCFLGCGIILLVVQFIRKFFHWR